MDYRYSVWVICPRCNDGRWVKKSNTYTSSYTGMCKKCTLIVRNWRGGRRKNKGHIELFLPEHPLANGSGYIRRSHIIIEENTGSPVPEGFEVHHINGDKLDDSFENLQVLSTVEHARVHYKDRSILPDGRFETNS